MAYGMYDDFLGKIDIVDIISDYTRLKKQGNEMIGLCPLHNEKTPSFHVSREKQMYYCFGCKKGGNAVSFVCDKEGLDYADAMRYLSEKTGVPLPHKTTDRSKKQRDTYDQSVKINTEAARIFYENLKSNHAKVARDYLKSRGLSASTIRKYGLGYASQEWDDCLKRLINKGYTQKEIIEAGLALKTSKGSVIDRFRNRIMFPIFDIRTNVIAFGGRVLDDAVPKYMNSPQTPCYRKKEHLYGLNFARKSEEENIIVVEGYMDAIMLYQSGFDNVVASLGTALTERQALLLKRYAKEVLISYDADAAGQIAALKGMDILAAKSCQVRVIELPTGYDPDDYIKKEGAGAYRLKMQKACSLVEYKAKVIKRTYDMQTTGGQVRFIKHIALELSKLESEVEVEIYAKKIAKEYGISTDAILSEIKGEKGYDQASTNTVFPKKMNKERVKDDTNEQERRLLVLFSLYNQALVDFQQKEGDAFFDDNDNLLIYKEMKKHVLKGNLFPPAMIMQMTDEQKSAMFANIIQNTHIESKSLIKKAIEEIVNRKKLHTTTKRYAQVLSEIEKEEDLVRLSELKKEYEAINEELTRLKRKSV